MFDKLQALYCLKLCNMSYSKNVTRSLEDIKIFDREDVQGFISLRDEGTIYTTFRPTDSDFDWLRNFFAWKTVRYLDNKPVKIHAGFEMAWGAVEKIVLQTLEKYLGYRIIITGHSLGGALAQLCALFLAYYYPGTKPEGYSFGAPIVGDEAFAQKLSEYVPEFYRVENGQDWVTRVPYECFMYKPAGIRVHVGEVRKDWMIFGRLGKDHYPDKYAANINKLEVA